jgi:cytochrome c-type biogenesis protein CcsB
MFKMSEYSLIAAVMATGLAFLLYVAYVVSGIRAARMQTAGGPARTQSVGLAVGPGTAMLGRYGTILGWLGFLFLTAWLIFRTVSTGHGPFANMYEFSVAFAWGVMALYYWFERSYGQRVLGLFALPIALGMMVYALTLPSAVEQLVPALQNNLLLSVHVAVAIVAYGSFTVAFAAAMLYLLQQGLQDRIVAAGSLATAVIAVISIVRGLELLPVLGLSVAAFAVAGGTVWVWARGRELEPGQGGGFWGLPRPQVLDEMSYKAVVVGYPFLTLVIILGALWADVAWGRYWAWDPKETASLVTWLIYGAYLHARVVRGWRGNRAAYLLLLGFAATLFTYFGNLFFGGLHSYAGLK